MKRIVSVFLAIFLLAVSVLSVAATATPFDLDVARAQQAVSAAVGKDTAGAAVVLVKNGTVLMADGFGYADLASRVLVTGNTVFEIGELSAIFTAIAALTLADSGALSPDADIANYLPAEFMEKLALRYPVTVSDLLSGRAGFGGRIFDISFQKESHTFETLEEALLADIPEQIMLPGTAYAYSPFGIALAAFVVEEISGVSYQTYVTEHVLAPLGMENTAFVLAQNTAPVEYATGYTVAAEGSFTAPKNGGRSFSGLYPATGASSCANDLSRLLLWLVSDNETLLSKETKARLFTACQSGMFAPGALVLKTHGTAGYTLAAKTACFGASLCLDLHKGAAALVLTNTPESGLLALPTDLFPATKAPLSLPTGEMVDLKALRGTYAAASEEQHTFVGQLFTIQRRVSATVNDDGTFSFLGMRLVQIAPGVFADAEEDDNTPLVQFLLDGEGEVAAVVTAAGECYHKLPFYYAHVPSAFLLGLLLLFAAGFVLMGVFGFFEWLAGKSRDGERTGVWCVLPELLTAVLGLLVAAEVLVAYKMGAAVLSSFYFAMRVLTLLVGIGATASYIIAFVFSVLDRKLHKRIAFMAILYLIFVFLICFFNLTLI